jgi:hypothetical protein
MKRRRAFYIAAAACVGAACATGAHGQAEYEAPSLIEAVKTTPCQAFRKDIDGAWLLIAGIRIGDSVVFGKVWQDTRESKILDARCGGK